VDLALTQLIDNERFGAERIAAFINDTQGATVEGLADR